MTDCDEFFDLLVLYVNDRLEKNRVNEVMRHLSACAVCRKTLAELITLKKLAAKNEIPVPPDVKKSAFDKISFPELTPSVLDSVLAPFRLIRETLSPVQKTLSLVRQNI